MLLNVLSRSLFRVSSHTRTHNDSQSASRDDDMLTSYTVTHSSTERKMIGTCLLLSSMLAFYFSRLYLLSVSTLSALWVVHYLETPGEMISHDVEVYPFSLIAVDPLLHCGTSCFHWAIVLSVVP